MKSKQIIKGHIAALIAILIWGSTFISTTTLLQDFQPIEIIVYRFLIGFLVLCIAFPRFIKPKSIKEELTFAGAGATGITFYCILENTALTLTSASSVGVIISTAPFFTAILAMFFWRNEKPKKKFFLGFLTAIVGISIISFNGTANLALNPLGDVMAIGAALSWAFYNILLRKISTFGYKAIQVNQRIFGYGLLFTIPALFPLNFQWGFERFANPINLGNILFLGVGASAFCFVIWNMAVNILGPVKTSIYIYLIPVVTIITAALILREPITLMLAIGTVLALMGLVISEWRGKNKQ